MTNTRKTYRYENGELKLKIYFSRQLKQWIVKTFNLKMYFDEESEAIKMYDFIEQYGL